MSLLGREATVGRMSRCDPEATFGGVSYRGTKNRDQLSRMFIFALFGWGHWFDPSTTHQ
jgi:hypothetical protein